MIAWRAHFNALVVWARRTAEPEKWRRRWDVLKPKLEAAGLTALATSKRWGLQLQSLAVRAWHQTRQSDLGNRLASMRPSRYEAGPRVSASTLEWWRRLFGVAARGRVLMETVAVRRHWGRLKQVLQKLSRIGPAASSSAARASTGRRMRGPMSLQRMLRLLPAPSGHTFAPAQRHAWLATPTSAPRLRWPFGLLGTFFALALLGMLGIVVLLMTFPVLSPHGPAGLVYWLHDNVILPWRGRIFERYAPVPQILLLALVTISALMFTARRTGFRIYLVAVALWQQLPAGRALLGAWLGWRREDAPLWAALELDFRRRVDAWLQDPDDVRRTELVEGGLSLLKQAWVQSERRHDQARTAIGVRTAFLNALSSGTEAPTVQTELSAALSAGGGPFAKKLVQLLEAGADPEAAVVILDAAWLLAESTIPPDDDLARDTVLWFAWCASVLCSDTALADQVQILIAATAFNRDSKTAVRKTQDTLYFNPALTALSGERSHRAAIPGAVLPWPGLKALADRIDTERPDLEAAT